jgi:hypothetical protein
LRYLLVLSPFVIPWGRVLLEKLTAAEPAKQFLAFMEFEESLQFTADLNGTNDVT